MKIIQINKFNYLRGGAEKYFLELSERLTQAGHEVAKFCMTDRRNLNDTWSGYWLSRIDFEQPALSDKLRAPERIIYSRAAKRSLAKLIKDFQPDIIHVHNIYHQLSPSVLDAAREAKVPVVMTLHDYKLICPNYQLLNHGQVCEKCLDGNFWHCFQEKCFKDSRSQSFLASLEAVLHKRWQTYWRGVDLFIAPSQFMADKCQAAGWPKDRFRVLINPVPELPAGQRQAAGYFLYAGRLSNEKGVDVLLKALAGSSYKLKIAGRGPQENALRQLAKDLKLSEQVDFLGQQGREQLAKLLDGAIALTVPSIWYENMPLNILEALGRGCPVVASRIGGIPEIINNQINGWLAEPGDSKSWLAALELASQANQIEFSQQAKLSVEEYSWEKHFLAVEVIYQQILQNRSHD